MKASIGGPIVNQIMWVCCSRENCLLAFSGYSQMNGRVFVGAQKEPVGATDQNCHHLA